LLIIVTEKVIRTVKVNGKKTKVTDTEFRRYAVNTENQVNDIVNREKKKSSVTKITVGTKTVYQKG